MPNVEDHLVLEDLVYLDPNPIPYDINFMTYDEPKKKIQGSWIKIYGSSGDTEYDDDEII